MANEKLNAWLYNQAKTEIEGLKNYLGDCFANIDFASKSWLVQVWGFDSGRYEFPRYIIYTNIEERLTVTSIDEGKRLLGKDYLYTDVGGAIYRYFLDCPGSCIVELRPLTDIPEEIRMGQKLEKYINYAKVEEDGDGNPQGGWKGVDLDATLAEYHGFVGHKVVGEPIPRMVKRVKKWLSEGIEVRIVTARVGPLAHKEDEAREVIQEWCKKHIGVALPVTHEKDLHMWELWDDRVVQVERNTARRIDGLEDDCPTVPEALMSEVKRLEAVVGTRVEAMSRTKGAFAQYQVAPIGLADLKALGDVLSAVKLGQPQEEEETFEEDPEDTEGKDYWVHVCADCLTVVCMKGELLCETGVRAGIIKKRASELRKLGREHPGNYAEKALKEACAWIGYV